MKIIFVVGSLNDSHIIKRIESFIQHGYDVEVYGYKRIGFINKFNNIQPIILGELENAKYLNRIYKVFKTINSIIKEHPKDSLYYLWGFDITLVHFFKRTKYIYEISDIRYADFKFCLNNIFRFIDKKMIERSKIVLFTSEGFINYLGLDKQLMSKCILFPNKISSKLATTRKTFCCNTSNTIRIGFIGLYRYRNTVIKMARLIGEEYKNKFQFHFFGIANKEEIKQEINKLVEMYGNVFEHGPFRNPNDLHKVYDSIDLVACNYDITGTNERIAEPNKLYESIFFNKAIIVSENTFLSQRVRKLGCGYIINSHTKESLRRFLDSITLEDVIEKSQKSSQIQTSEIVDNYEPLFNEINKIK